MTYFLLKDYNILPKKELHSSLWVDRMLRTRLVTLGSFTIIRPASRVAASEQRASFVHHHALLCCPDISVLISGPSRWEGGAQEQALVGFRGVARLLRIQSSTLPEFSSKAWPSTRETRSLSLKLQQTFLRGARCNSAGPWSISRGTCSRLLAPSSRLVCEPQRPATCGGSRQLRGPITSSNHGYFAMPQTRMHAEVVNKSSSRKFGPCCTNYAHFSPPSNLGPKCTRNL